MNGKLIFGISIVIGFILMIISVDYESQWISIEIPKECDYYEYDIYPDDYTIEQKIELIKMCDDISIRKSNLKGDSSMLFILSLLGCFPLGIFLLADGIVESKEHNKKKSKKKRSN